MHKNRIGPRTTSRRALKAGLLLALALAGVQPASASGPARTVLEESAGEQLQLSLSYDPATLERIRGEFQWGKASCQGTVQQVGVSPEGEIVLQQQLRGGNCVRGCQIMVHSDLLRWREVCQGRDAGSGSFTVADNGPALRTFMLAQFQDQAARREKAERAAWEARQLPQPDTTADVRGAAARKQLRAQVLHADDFGFVALRDPAGNWELLASGEWHQGRPGTSPLVELTPKLKTGTNLVVLGIHNKAFALGPGRWSYAFELTGDGGKVWQGQGGSAGGAVGIRWWKAVRVDRDKAGNLVVTPASDALLASLRPHMSEMHEYLVKQHGSETSAMQAVVGAVASSMFGGGGAGNSRNRNDEAMDANDRYAREAEQRYQREAAAREAAAAAASERLRHPNSLGW